MFWCIERGEVMGKGVWGIIPLSARICPNWTSAFEAYLGGSRDKYGRIWWADGNNTNLASTYIIDIIGLGYHTNKFSPTKVLKPNKLVK